MQILGEPVPTDILNLTPEQQARFWRMIQTPPADKYQLQTWVWKVLGIWISDVACCPEQGHRAPLDAFAAAYFATHPRIVWMASRGLGGKTALLAALSLTEIITLKASVSLLGGSGEQSERVHAYMSGEELRKSFWRARYAPRHLLLNDPSKRETKLRGGGALKALMASTASVRGPHPERLRGDEIDEMDATIWDAASGQPITRVTAAGMKVRRQIVGSSTHQYPDGTMTREMRMAKERGWPTFIWCYRANLRTRQNPRGWLTEEMVEETRDSVTLAVWQNEYELQEPVPEGRAIDEAAVEAMFRRELGESDGGLGTKYIIEEYAKGGEYAVGADWGKNKDKTIIWVLRTDVLPMRFVAFLHLGRQPYPQMIGAYNDVCTRYHSSRNAHDITGLGTVVDDYIEVMSEGVKMQGAPRARLFNEYILAIEQGEVVAPFIEYALNEHKFVTLDDLYGKGHPPDAFVAGAITWHAFMYGGGELLI